MTVTAEEPDQLTVPVPGGSLHALSWGPVDGPAVIAVHGITANAWSWALVGGDLADAGIRVVAPDLRGRGRSAALGASASIGRHADDVWVLADHLGQDTTVLVGHSMGGFVVATAAVRRPERTRAVVLVDGGPPLIDAVPAVEQVEPILDAVIGPALRRLDRTFADREEYRAFWAAHPGLAAGTPTWLLHAYADHDLVADGATWRSSVVREAVIADARDTLTDPEVLGAVGALTSPVHMLAAERGMLDGPDPLYAEDRLAVTRAAQPRLRVDRVAGTNHYTISTAPTGARAIADAVRDAVGDR